MKTKSVIASVLCTVVMAGMLTGCSNSGEFIKYLFTKEVTKETSETEVTSEITTEPTEPEPVLYLPEQTEINSICQLATLECYYHNVAKSTKEAGSGFEHMGEKNRKFWIEYNATAKIGIDFNQVKMSVDETNGEIYIILPQATVLGEVNVDSSSYNMNSYIEEPDSSFNKNEIDSADITQAIDNSLAELQERIMSDNVLMSRARQRAQDLIENYINELAELSGVDYHITWEYAEQVGG